MSTPKTFFLSMAVCIVLTGCSPPSARWNTVRSVRVDTRDAEDPSGAYAQHLSSVLKKANVEHRIVTYNYRYRTVLREEAIGTRTAVIYRDEKNPNNPWWLMDERLYKPVWLPGDDENRQISFYLHRPATVISTTIIGEGDGKRVISGPESSTGDGGMLARAMPVKNMSPQSAGTSRLTALFRTRHGTDFDRASVVDRRKMEQLVLETGSRQARLF